MANTKKDKKLIIDAVRHNCPHCGTKSARYNDISFMRIDIENGKHLYAMFIQCCECQKVSMHLMKNLPFTTKREIVTGITTDGDYHHNGYLLKAEDIDKLDENIIMSIPTPTFIIDVGIPNVIL